MQAIFKDLRKAPGVNGLYFFATDGRLVFAEALKAGGRLPEADGWAPFLAQLANVREADLLFEGARVFVRRAAAGILVVVLEAGASSAMIRLHGDIVMTQLGTRRPARGIKRFFRR